MHALGLRTSQVIDLADVRLRIESSAAIVRASLPPPPRSLALPDGSLI